MVKYNIISTGSDGNATILEDFVLIDCGVPYKALEPYVTKLKLVLLTHIHSDHFQKRTIKRLAEERPTLRFGCCRWLAPPLLAAGVPERQIDVLEPRTMYGYGLCNVIPFMLTHNVPNCGYKVHFPSGKVIYATDTNNLNGVQALGYDLYLIEANYRDEDIQAKIAEKKAAGQYAYEMQVLKNHLSEAKCNDFLVRNMQANSVYIPMHVHVDKEKTDGRNGENRDSVGFNFTAPSLDLPIYTMPENNDEHRNVQREELTTCLTDEQLSKYLGIHPGWGWHMDKVPCIRVDDLTDEQIRAYRIADNKVAEASSWNDDVLRAEMDALKALDVDLTDTGFSEVELDGLLREVEDADFEEFFTEPVQQPPKAADAEQSAETQQSTQPESSQLAVPQQSGSKLIQCPHCGEWFET